MKVRICLGFLTAAVKLADKWAKTALIAATYVANSQFAMLKSKSSSIIDKLKRNVWLELLLTDLVGIGLLVYAFSIPNGRLKWMIISILVVFFLYTFYFIKKLLLLNRFEQGQDIKTNLELLAARLTGYLLFYKRSYAILYPVYFIIGLLFVAVEKGFDQFIHSITQPKALLYLIVMSLVFLFASTWFVRWYLRKLYGNHVEKLKNLLKEISEA